MNKNNKKNSHTPSALSREQQSKNCCDKLKKDSSKNAKHIRYESFGTDSTKKNKNEDGCGRGRNSGVARYCSSNIRTLYPSELLGDDEMSEYCVNGRLESDGNNRCELCRIDVAGHNGATPDVNFAEALLLAMDGNNDNTDPDKRNQRLMAFMEHFIKEKYPGNGAEDESSLRITVNGRIWVEYYLKLIPHSSLLKTSAPSGYKYKDRISIGRMIKIQGNSNKNLVFYLTKDPNYSDPQYEQERPVVNCVGFWNLLEAPQRGEIRNIIHLNKEQMVHINFGFIITDPRSVGSIEVDLITKRQSIRLWTYGSNHNAVPMDQVQETKESDQGLGNVMANPGHYDTVHAQSQYLAEINESGHHSDTTNSSPSLEPSPPTTAPQSPPTAPPHHHHPFPQPLISSAQYPDPHPFIAPNYSHPNQPYHDQRQQASYYHHGTSQQQTQIQQPPDYQHPGYAPSGAPNQTYYNGATNDQAQQPSSYNANPQQQQQPANNYDSGYAPSGVAAFNGITAPDLPSRAGTFDMTTFPVNMTPAPLLNMAQDNQSVIFSIADDFDTQSYGPSRAAFHLDTLFRFDPIHRPQSMLPFNNHNCL